MSAGSLLDETLREQQKDIDRLENRVCELITTTRGLSVQVDELIQKVDMIVQYSPSLVPQDTK